MKKVIIEMENGGVMSGELYEDIAPITVENFEKLAKDGFYNGLTFHRVIPGFMIQEAVLRATWHRRTGIHHQGRVYFQRLEKRSEAYDRGFFPWPEPWFPIRRVPSSLSW